MVISHLYFCKLLVQRLHLAIILFILSLLVYVSSLYIMDINPYILQLSLHRVFDGENQQLKN